MSILEREEYVEQAHFFRALGERLLESVPLQDLLAQVREEILSTTKLPMAIDFLLAELKHSGVFTTAMARLAHYFTPFQTFIMREAENERGKFDFRVALDVLRYEAEFRATDPSPPGLFTYQFETICRNRLRYDYGLAAMATDPLYDGNWREWIMGLRRQIGTVDLADLIFVRSQHYLTRREHEARQRGEEAENIPPERPVLFGEKEGKIALANRRKDPLYLFSALQRHLNYPTVPRRKPIDDAPHLLPQLQRRLEQLESRLKLLEEDQRGGIDITKFYERPPGTVPPPDNL